MITEEQLKDWKWRLTGAAIIPNKGYLGITDGDEITEDQFIDLTRKVVPALITYIEQLEKTIEIDSVGRDILEANQAQIAKLEVEIEWLQKEIKGYEVTVALQSDKDFMYNLEMAREEMRSKAAAENKELRAEVEQLQVKLDAAIALSETLAKMADVVKEVYETQLTRIREATEPILDRIQQRAYILSKKTQIDVDDILEMGRDAEEIRVLVEAIKEEA